LLSHRPAATRLPPEASLHRCRNLQTLSLGLILSEPAIVMRNGELIAARTGKAGAVDPAARSNRKSINCLTLLSDTFALQNLMDSFFDLEPLTSQLSSIRIPTMILNGEFDFLTPRALQDSLRKHIPLWRRGTPCRTARS
jgi:pimeloyl-ACP methyl ester carboxylesterase